MGELQTDEGHRLWYCGEEKKKEKGVGFLVNKDTVNAVMECHPISSRLISIRLAATPKNISIIQVYAPTSTHTEEEIETFYQDLKAVLKGISKKDVLIIQGDWNAKIGTDAYQDWAGTVGKFGLEETNERGLRLLEFAKYYDMILANTLHHYKYSRRITWHAPNGEDKNQLLEFARYYDMILANTLHNHKASRRITWHAPNGEDKNQIDFILSPKRYASSIIRNKTRSFPGADVGSDHDLVMMTMRLKLRRLNKQQNI